MKNCPNCNTPLEVDLDCMGPGFACGTYYCKECKFTKAWSSDDPKEKETVVDAFKQALPDSEVRRTDKGIEIEPKNDDT